MSNLLEQAIECSDGEQAARIIQSALGIESDDVVNYCLVVIPEVVALTTLALRVLVEGHSPKQPRQKAGSVARAGKGIGRRSDAVDLKVLKEI